MQSDNQKRWDLIIGIKIKLFISKPFVKEVTGSTQAWKHPFLSSAKLYIQTDGKHPFKMIQMSFGTEREYSHSAKKKEDSSELCSTCTSTNYHLMPSELPKIPERKTEQIITGLTFRTCFLSCCTLRMAETSQGLCYGSVQTCWGNSMSSWGGRQLVRTQTFWDCLELPNSVIFPLVFSCFFPSFHLCLTFLPLLHFASSICLPNPLKCWLSETILTQGSSLSRWIKMELKRSE